MITIFKMRLLHFKRNYHIFAIMSALTLFFVFVFNLQSGTNAVRLGWVLEPNAAPYEALYENMLSSADFKVTKVPRSEGVQQLADMKLDYLITFDEENAAKVPQIKLLSLVQDTAHIEAKMRLENYVKRYFSDRFLAHEIQISLKVLTDQVTVGDAEKWFDMLQKNVDQKPTAVMKIERVGSSVWLNYNNKLHNMIGFSLMFSMFTLVFSVADILTDFQNHTWGRMNIAPVKFLSVVVGYFTPTVLLGFIQLSLLYVLGAVLFQIDFGQHLLALMGFLFLYAMTITGLAILMSSLLKTRAQAGAVTAVVINATSMLGGCMWPLAVVQSKVILGAAQFMPQKWAIEALEGLTMYGREPSEFLLQACVLLMMAVILTALGMTLFLTGKKRRLSKA